MPKTLEEVARDIKVLIDSASVIRIWGANRFRPADVTYEVVGASAADELLRIHLYLALDDTRPVIEVHSPKGIKVEKGKLRIKDAARVRWDKDEHDKPGTGDPALYVGN